MTGCTFLNNLSIQFSMILVEYSCCISGFYEHLQKTKDISNAMCENGKLLFLRIFNSIFAKAIAVAMHFECFHIS